MIEIRRPQPEELESLYVIEVACFEEAYRWDEPVFVQELKKSQVWVADYVETFSPRGTCQSAIHTFPWKPHQQTLSCVDWKQTEEIERETVGFLVARTKDGGGYVTSIDVLPDHRKKGIGAKLLYAAEEYYKEQGLPRIWLEVEVNNPAQTLYFKLGYRVKRVREKWYDNGGDCLVMAKPLDLTASQSASATQQQTLGC